jgi:hypothetical protein
MNNQKFQMKVFTQMDRIQGTIAFDGCTTYKCL